MLRSVPAKTSWRNRALIALQGRAVRVGRALPLTDTSDERTAPHRIAMRAQVADDKELERIHTECIAEKVLVGWRNITDKQTGEPLSYTPQRACQKMVEDVRFKNFIMDNAGRLELFRSKDREEVEKNS